MESPPDVRSGIICKPLDDGRIQVTMVREGIASDLTVDAVQASQLAGHVLTAARQSFERSGKQAPDFTKEQSQYMPVRVSSMGLGPSSKPNMECLMLQFGGAILAIELEVSALQSIGAALMALSADGKRQ